MGEGRSNRLADLCHARFGTAFEVPQGFEDDPRLIGLMNHSSHRAFLDRALPDGLLDMLLACGFSAPSKSDLQQTSAIKITDPGKRQAIAALVPQFPWAQSAPAFVVFCGDNRRLRRVGEMRGKPFANDHLDMFMNCAVDAALVIGNVIQACEAVGLGGCPVSMIRDQIDALQEILQLPEGVFPVAGLAIGYPSTEGYVTPRLSLETTVHENVYDDSSLEAEIEAYDRRRHETAPFDQAKQRHVESYEDATFYGWSEDKARQYGSPQRADFGSYVRRQGFSLD